jgi:hypothetical protein
LTFVFIFVEKNQNFEARVEKKLREKRKKEKKFARSKGRPCMGVQNIACHTWAHLHCKLGIKLRSSDFWKFSSQGGDHARRFTRLLLAKVIQDRN